MKVTKGDKVWYFLRRGEITHLKEAYNKYRWKFPEIKFHEKFVTYNYINKRMNALKYIIFVIRCYISDAFFYDDSYHNVVNGKLIDYNACDKVPRTVGLLGSMLSILQELNEKCFIKNLAYKSNIFKKYFEYMYTVKKSDEIMICKNEYRTVTYDKYLNIIKDTRDDR